MTAPAHSLLTLLETLGGSYAAVMATDDDLAARLATASERTGEPVWRLPLPEEALSDCGKNLLVSS